VVPRGPVVVAVRLDHRQRDASVLHLPIAPAERAEQIRPANLEPHEVVRVVDDPHLVGLGVTDPNGGDRRSRRHAPSGLTAAARRWGVAPAGSSALKIECPATRIRAPAATTRGAVDTSMPPSTSIGAGFRSRSSKARAALILDSLRGMKV